MSVTFFPGSAGNYKLDGYGDRDVELSVIYTTTEHKVLPVTVVHFEDGRMSKHTNAVLSSV